MEPEKPPSLPPQSSFSLPGLVYILGSWVVLIVGAFAMSKRSRSQRPQQPNPLMYEDRHPEKNDPTVSPVQPTAPEYPEHPNCTKKREEEAPIWKWLKRVGILAGIFYAIVTFFMYRANKKAANAAESAAVTAKETLIKVQRPWMGVDGTPTVESDGRGFSATMKNFGKTPALKVGIMMKKSTSEEARKNLDAACKQAWRTRELADIYSPMTPTSTHEDS